MSLKDPTADIYRMFDEAGLNGGHLLTTQKSMTQIVSDIRMKLAASTKAYIERRDAETFKAGVQSTEPRKIEVQGE